MIDTCVCAYLKDINGKWGHLKIELAFDGEKLVKGITFWTSVYDDIEGFQKWSPLWIGKTQAAGTM